MAPQPDIAIPPPASSRPLLRIIAVALLVFSANAQDQTTGSAAPGTTAAATFSKEAVQAAFLVQFIRFTIWPDELEKSTGAFVLAVANHRALEDELIRIAARELVRERRLRIVRVRSPRDLEGAHLAWLRPDGDRSDFYPSRVEDALADLRRRPVLTISDAPGFLGAGGMIQLFRDGRNVRFSISPDPAREAGLALSSSLLALSRPAPAAQEAAR